MQPEAVNHSGLVSQLLNVFLYVGSEWVMYLLIFLSVLSVGIALERGLFFLQRRTDLPVLLDKLQVLLARGDVGEAKKHLQRDVSLPARVAEAGLDALPRGTHAAEEMMASITVRERQQYERGLAYLGTLGNNAPFVGLFGTVLGIIRSFRDLAANTQQGASAVMAGIAEALVATAVGLLVALPAVAVFNAYNRHLRSLTSSADALSHLVLSFAKLPDSSESPAENKARAAARG
jgi:biopolymer transport protein ExbB/TolQ